MNKLNKPVITKETIRAMEDMSFFTHAKIFDDLLIVAQKETNCFVLKTSNGLIVIDAIWPIKKAFEAIVDAIKDVGWNIQRSLIDLKRGKITKLMFMFRMVIP